MSTLRMRIGEFDRLALNALVLRRRRTLDRLMRGLTHLGGAVVMIATAAGLVFLTGPELRPAGLEAAFALLTSHIAVQRLKRTVARPRPRLPTGIGTLIATPDRFSFPSGHAAASLSVALPLAAVLPAPAGLSVLTLATIVGLSRVYLGVHYPGDVLMGWALAGLAATVAPFAVASTTWM